VGAELLDPLSRMITATAAAANPTAAPAAISTPRDRAGGPPRPRLPEVCSEGPSRPCSHTLQKRPSSKRLPALRAEPQLLGRGVVSVDRRHELPPARAQPCMKRRSASLSTAVPQSVSYRRVCRFIPGPEMASVCPRTECTRRRVKAFYFLFKDHVFSRRVRYVHPTQSVEAAGLPAPWTGYAVCAARPT